METLVGDILAGKYAVERVLACGGSGVVVQARHLTLREPCAIKLLRPEALMAPHARARFLREARATARLKSEHVVKVFDVGELEDDTPYLVMEYVEGTDLEVMIEERGPLPVAEAALYITQICAALAEAHHLGIVHRDIKPANILVTRGPDGEPRVKLVDFGISKLLLGGDSMVTLKGTVMGTPAFMSPEQINAGEIDTRTDIWAIGALLYHLVTGALPFPTGDGVMESLAFVLTSPAIPPSRRVPDLPPALERLILWCLEKRPDDRPGTVTEIAAVLSSFTDRAAAALPDRVRRILEGPAPPLLPPPEAPLRVAMAPTIEAPAPPVAIEPYAARAIPERIVTLIALIAAAIVLILAIAAVENV